MSGHRGVRVAGVVALMALVGCSADPGAGYSFGSSYDTSVKTVSVPIFANETFETGLETELTEAIIKRIQRDTPWKVTTTEGAETRLTGSITEAALHAVSRARGTGLVQELTYEITVDFDWRDNRSGESLVERRKFTGVGAFVPALGSGERVEVGRREAIEELAHDIVAELRSDW